MGTDAKILWPVRNNIQQYLHLQVYVWTNLEERVCQRGNQRLSLTKWCFMMWMAPRLVRQKPFLKQLTFNQLCWSFKTFLTVQSCRSIELEHHRSPCRCSCLVTAASCTPHQRFDPARCACACDQTHSRAKYSCALNPNRHRDSSYIFLFITITKRWTLSGCEGCVRVSPVLQGLGRGRLWVHLQEILSSRTPDGPLHLLLPAGLHRDLLHSARVPVHLPPGQDRHLHWTGGPHSPRPDHRRHPVLHHY